MERFIVGSTWDRINRNGINNNFDYLFEGVATMNNLNIKADATLLKADAVLMNAQNINQSNVDVQKQLDNIIVESGTSDAEVVQSRTAYNGEEFTTLKNRLDKRDENLLTRIVNAIDFGIVGDGVTDDTLAIQSALDYAKDNGGELFLPEAEYLISSTLYLNGVTLRGNVGNIFATGEGTIIKCATKDFKAVAQGSTSVKDIQFNISNIIIEDAEIGLELNYVINSKYENIYVKNSDIAYKLGDKNSVGSMFNEFNNLYTSGCRVGIESDSKEFFNNNVFNNGFIQGTDYAAKINVTGGYGAVNNTFNNVEFRSPMGRGIILNRATNTVLNYCYTEAGGHSIIVGKNSSVVVNDPVFGLFKQDNTNGDKSIIHFEEGVSFSTLNGGRIFLSSEYDGASYVTAHASVPSERINVTRDVRISGSLSTVNFTKYPQKVDSVINRNHLNKFVDLQLKSETFNRGETHKLSDFTVKSNTEVIDGSQVKLSEGYWTIDARVKLNIGPTAASKYFYVRKNGVNIISEIHAYTGSEKDLQRFTISKTEYIKEGDIIEFVVFYEQGDTTMNIVGGTQSFITLKYLG